MANKWGIHPSLERKLRQDIKKCVYCGVKMKEYSHKKGTPRDKATWEHIDNKLWQSKSLSVQKKNVVRCCHSCNSSKGTKELGKWLESKGIRVSSIKNRQVREYLDRY